MAIRGWVASIVFVAVAGSAATAHAQTAGQAPAAPPSNVTFRGMEAGFDVTATNPGDAGFYLGASGRRGVMSVRFTVMDEAQAVPCSVNVMYEHILRKDRSRITPTAGASLGRVFSCATESDGIRPSPLQPGIGALTAGVRFPVFTSTRRVGSLKVLGIAQRRFGGDAVEATTTFGFSVGFVVGQR